MPASPEPRSGNPIEATTSCSLSKRFRRWAAKDFGPRILRGIARVWTRGVDGFDWKEVAANLQVEEATLHDSFWDEIRQGDSPQEMHSERQNVIQKPQDRHPVDPTNSASPR